MSYISALTKGNKVYVWERTEEGRKIKLFDSPFYFFTEDPTGDYKSMFGDKLTKHEFNSDRAFKEKRNILQAKGVRLYEADLTPDLKVLSQNYYQVPAPTPNITFLDIEVDYNVDRGFSSVEDPYAPLNSIAIYHQWKNEIVAYAVSPEGQEWTKEDLIDEMNKIEKLPEDVNIRVFISENEEELLLDILDEIEDSDVLCGWNSDFFDVPYIAKRIELTLGEYGLKKLSFDSAKPPKFRTIERYGKEHTMIDLSGRISVDYLELFRKYEMAGRPSYKLEAIAESVLVDDDTKEPLLPKLEYKGTLHKLYRTNFPWFVRYNIRDTEVLKGFEEKLGYVALANEMVHISTGQWSHVLGTLKLAELAINNFCNHEKHVRFPDKGNPVKGSIAGAYVLHPKKGGHKWIGSIDINSLYPSAIRSNNISPETIIGQFDDTENAVNHISNKTDDKLRLVYEDGTNEIHKAKDWNTILRENQCGISGYGTVFDQTEQGIIPAILEDWYNTRKLYQKKMRSSKDPTEAAYNNRLQYTYKIKLNALYGAMTNAYFRYYDLRMGESTTATGRMILLHQSAETNKLLAGKYDYEGDAVIYGDTDSTYFNLWAKDEEEAVLVADTVAEKVNDTFNQYMRDTFLCQPGFDDIIKAGRENVASSGIFVDKKMYILRVVDSEGKKVDKLKVMGLQIKKTTIPMVIGKQLETFIGRYLRGEEWNDVARDIVELKNTLMTTDDLSLLGLPKGIKGIEEYTQEYIKDDLTRLPGHVAAAIHYNLAKEIYNDKESLEITSGMKIRVYYLTAKFHSRFISIALPTDLEKIPQWFLDDYKIDRKKQIVRLVDKPLGIILNAIDKKPPDPNDFLIDNLLGF